MAAAGGDDDLDRLTSLCHDLRQYLAAGLLLSGTMPGDDELPDAVRQRLNQIHDQFRSVSDMIAAELQDTSARSALVDLAYLVGDCVEVARLATGAAIALEVSARPGLHGDAAMLRRAVSNLLDNACRAIEPNGRVLVKVGLGEDGAFVDVEDDGLGFGMISAGLGQGLPLVRATVKAHRGRLEIGHASLGGTLVRVLLPVSTQQERPA